VAVNNELERMWPVLRYYTSICLKAMTKRTKTLSE